MSLNLKMLGTNIQSKRKSKHLNQEELAYRVGISRNYLSMIERLYNKCWGKQVEPTKKK
mgnify:FL=1